MLIIRGTVRRRHAAEQIPQPPQQHLARELLQQLLDPLGFAGAAAAHGHGTAGKVALQAVPGPSPGGLGYLGAPGGLVSRWICEVAGNQGILGKNGRLLLIVDRP